MGRRGEAFSAFGIDPDTLNPETTGAPGIRFFASAVQVYAICNPGCKVTDAADAFNVDLELVVEAVEDHPWMYLEEDLEIAHEGE